MKYEIGHRIKAYRKARKYSQKELAELIGVSNSRVSNWEQGINRPDADIIASICKVLDISPSELLNVHVSSEEYTSRERLLIESYRNKPELQAAIDILLGLTSEKL